MLDLGCGSGWLSIYLARAGFQVTGLDVAPRAIELARAWAEEESLKIQFDIGDLAELSYPGSSFDAVVANSIFEHLNLELARQTVKRLRELLVAGGSFIGCFDRVGGGPGEYYQLPDGTHVYTDKARKGMLLRFYEDTELSQLFAGWQIDSMQELESGSRLLWARV